MHDIHLILCAFYLWPWLGPSLAALRYVMYFRLSISCLHKIGRMEIIPSQRVTSLRRLAQAITPLLHASYWLRRVTDDGGRRESETRRVHHERAAGGGVCNALLRCL